MASSVRKEITEIRDIVIRIDERQSGMLTRLETVEKRAARNGSVWGALTAILIAIATALGWNK